MVNQACLRRLRKEAMGFESPPYIRAAPLETNIQEWHYVLQGPPGSPYEGARGRLARMCARAQQHPRAHASG